MAGKGRSSVEIPGEKRSPSWFRSLLKGGIKKASPGSKGKYVEEAFLLPTSSNDGTRSEGGVACESPSSNSGNTTASSPSTLSLNSSPTDSSSSSASSGSPDKGREMGTACSAPQVLRESRIGSPLPRPAGLTADDDMLPLRRVDSLQLLKKKSPAKGGASLLPPRRGSPSSPSKVGGRREGESQTQLRVVSLLGAASEIVVALGLEGVMVARSHECKNIEAVKDLPCVTSPGVIGAAKATSDKQGEGNKEDVISTSLSRYQVDIKAVHELQPDVILTQDACDVCAVTSKDLQDACSAYFKDKEVSGLKQGCRVISLKPMTVNDIWNNVLEIATVLGEEEKGHVLVQALRTRWSAINQLVPPVRGHLGLDADGSMAGRPRVACLQWLNPLMGAGYWVPGIVACAGGKSVTGQAGEHTAVLPASSILSLDPDVIVLMCCGLSIVDTLRQLASLPDADLAQWNALMAVQKDRVFVADGDRYFNTSSPTVVDSAEMLLEILHITRSETHWAPPSLAATVSPDDPSSPRALRSPRTPTRLALAASLLHPPKYEGVGFIRLTGAAAEAWKVCPAWQSAMGVAGSAAVLAGEVTASPGTSGDGAGSRGFATAGGSPSPGSTTGAKDGGRPTTPPILPSDSIEGPFANVTGIEATRSPSDSPSAVQGLLSARRSGALGANRTVSVRKRLVPVKVPGEGMAGRQGEREAGKKAEISKGESSSKRDDSEANSSSSIGSSSSSSISRDTFSSSATCHAGSNTTTVSGSPSPPPSSSPGFSLYVSPPSSEDEESEGGGGKKKKKQPYRQSWVRALEGGTSSEEEATDSERERVGQGEGDQKPEQGQGGGESGREGAASQTNAGAAGQAGVSGPADLAQAGVGVVEPAQEAYAGPAAAAAAAAVAVAGARAVEHTPPSHGYASDIPTHQNAGDPLMLDMHQHHYHYDQQQQHYMDAMVGGGVPLPYQPPVLAGLALKVAQLRALFLATMEMSLPADCLLLSGGLSSTVIGHAAASIWPGSAGLAVTVLASRRAADRQPAAAAARACQLPHVIVGGGPGFQPEHLLETELKFVVRVLRTFDPAEIRSGIVLAAGLREAKRHGLMSVMVGDGADELFTAFDFMARMNDAKLFECRQHIINVLRFPCRDLAMALGLEVRQPFLHPALQEFALGLSKAELFGEERSEEWWGFNEGNLLLRMAFPEVISARRPKEPIEVGAGTSSLAKSLSRRISKDEFQIERARIKREDGISVRDPEHLHYYRAFRQVFGGPDVPGVLRWQPNCCQACGYPPLFADQLLCATCGKCSTRSSAPSSSPSPSPSSPSPSPSSPTPVPTSPSSPSTNTSTASTFSPSMNTSGPLSPTPLSPTPLKPPMASPPKSPTESPTGRRRALQDYGLSNSSVPADMPKSPSRRGRGGGSRRRESGLREGSVAEGATQGAAGVNGGHGYVSEHQQQQHQQQEQQQQQQGPWAGDHNSWQASDAHMMQHQMEGAGDGFSHHYSQQQQQHMYLAGSPPPRTDASGSPYLVHEPYLPADLLTPESKPAFAMSAEVLTALEVVDQAMSSGGSSSGGNTAGDQGREGLRFRVLDGALAGLVSCLDDGLAVWDSFIQLDAYRAAELKEHELEGDDHPDSFRSRGSSGSFMTAEEANSREMRRSSGGGGDGGRATSYGSEMGNEEYAQYSINQWGDSDAFTDATTEIAGFSESDEGCDSLRATDDEMTSSLSEVADCFCSK